MAIVAYAGAAIAAGIGAKERGNRLVNEQLNKVTLGQLLLAWWRERPKKVRRFGSGCSVLFALVWLAGAAMAVVTVDGIARLSGFAKVLMALSMGGFGLPWGGLKQVGLLQESQQQPNMLWLPLAFAMPCVIFGLVTLLSREPAANYLLKRRIKRFAESQGRLDSAEIAPTLTVTDGLPLATILNKRQQPISLGLDFKTGEGHVLVTGPTRSGKGLHLTETLMTWQGPLLVVDPKGEQLERTAALRSRLGPIYRLPGHCVELASYYQHLLDRDEIAELHHHWMRPWESRETIFADKARSLFNAAGLYAKELGLDPLRVLLDLAESDPTVALKGLERIEAVKRHVRVFTNGAEPSAYRDDKFVTSAYGNFTTRLAPYQKHIDTIAPLRPERIIPNNWVAQNATVYITYSLQELQGAGGIVASIIAAILRAQMRQQRQRLLVAIDELPALGLRNIVDYLATTGGYGITLLLYAQSISQLRDLYGVEGSRAILSNCVHQVWYPPAEGDSAEIMSKLYGLTLRANPSQSTTTGARQLRSAQGRSVLKNENKQASWSWQERPALLAAQFMGLNRDQVLVSTLKDRRYTLLANRLNPIASFAKLPSARVLRLPEPVYAKRVYTAWDSAETLARADTSPANSSNISEVF